MNVIFIIINFTVFIDLKMFLPMGIDSFIEFYNNKMSGNFQNTNLEKK